MTRPIDSIRAFEEAYAARSGTTVELLHSLGRYGAPCDCGEDGCEGFQMAFPWEDAIMEDRERERVIVTNDDFGDLLIESLKQAVGDGARVEECHFDDGRQGFSVRPA